MLEVLNMASQELERLLPPTRHKATTEEMRNDKNRVFEQSGRNTLASYRMSQIHTEVWS